MNGPKYRLEFGAGSVTAAVDTTKDPPMCEKHDAAKRTSPVTTVLTRASQCGEDDRGWKPGHWPLPSAEHPQVTQYLWAALWY